ncbi:MAG: CPBP family intramembrane glutamic endopeptidase [Microcoleaceae cyanobacterium]
MILSWLMGQPALIKVLIFFLVWIGVWLPIAVVSAILLNWHPPQPLSPQQKITLLGSLYFVVPWLIWGVTVLEQQTFSDYGWSIHRQTVFSISLGLVLGGLSLGLLYAVIWKLGAIDWQPSLNSDSQNSTALSLFVTLREIVSVGLIAFWISATEELVFRGFLQFQLQQDYSLWVAATLVSILFACSHLLWNSQETLPQLPGLWLMGMVLTTARFCDPATLALPIGLHASWIWGITLAEQRFVSNPKTVLPQWIVGNINQPLASLSSWVMLLTLAAVLTRL